MDRPAAPSPSALSTNDTLDLAIASILAGLLVSATLRWFRFPLQAMSDKRPDTPDEPDLEVSLLDTVEGLRQRGYTPHTLYVHPKHAATGMLVCCRYDLSLALDDTYPSSRAFVRCHGDET